MHERTERRLKIKDLTKTIADHIYTQFKRGTKTQIDDVQRWIQNYNDLYGTNITHTDIRRYFNSLSENDKTKLVQLRTHRQTLCRLLDNISVEEQKKRYQEKRFQKGQ